MIDLTPFLRCVGIPVEHLFDLGYAVRPNRIGPFLANPLICKAMIGGIHRCIDNIAGVVDRQHEVTRRIGEFDHVVFGKAVENSLRISKGNPVISWFQNVHRHWS